MSSAKSFTLDSTCLGTSFMQIKNNTGPKMEPYGTPLKTFVQLDISSSTIALCSVLLKNAAIYLPMSPHPTSLQLCEEYLMWHSIKCFLIIKKHVVNTTPLINSISSVFQCLQQIFCTRFQIMLLNCKKFFFLQEFNQMIFNK